MLNPKKIELGSYVTLKHDPAQIDRMVVRKCYILGGGIFYGLQSGTEYSEHSIEEISDDED